MHGSVLWLLKRTHLENAFLQYHSELHTLSKPISTNRKSKTEIGKTYTSYRDYQENDLLPQTQKVLVAKA